MDVLEANLLRDAIEQSYSLVDTTTRFSVNLIRSLHRMWLGSVYEFAGEIRKVDLIKNYFSFAPVAYMESTLRGLDEVLAGNTPCDQMDFERLVEAVTVVHVELVLAHPFREGNGRLSRWIADLMAAQNGRKALDWQFDDQTEFRRERYFAALRRGFAMDFKPLEALIREAFS